MNYNRPELGERLAVDYVLGLMPLRSRRRFERALTGSASLAAIVAGWSERLAPLDAATADTAPPAHVWRAIERRVGPGVVAPSRHRRLVLLWRGLVLTAAAACAAVVLYVAVGPSTLRGGLRDVADRVGLLSWVGSAQHAMPDIGLSTMRLGVPERERPRWLRAALLLTNSTLAVRPEPEQR